MTAVYLRTKDVIDIEERTGHQIEDFLDESCFVKDDSDYEEDDCVEDEEEEDA